MKEKFKNILKYFRKKIAFYLTSNRLFLSYLLFAILGTICLRNFTI